MAQDKASEKAVINAKSEKRRKRATKSSKSLPNKEETVRPTKAGFHKRVNLVRNTIGFAGIALIFLYAAIGLVWQSRGLGTAAAISSIVGVGIGSLALVLFLWVYRLMGPSLELRLGNRREDERPGLKYAFLHLVVINHPLTGSLEKHFNKIFHVDRRHATCEVHLDFLSRHEEKIYISAMPADWSSTPEPLTYIYDPSNFSGKAFPDITKKANRWTLDIRPTGRGESIAVAVKHEGQKECYAFNSESYFGATTGKPWCIERYKLDSEEIIVNAYLLSGGISQGPLRFRLINKDTCIDENCFKLETLD